MDQNAKRCPSCGTPLQPTDSFCPACGRARRKPKPQPEEQKYTSAHTAQFAALVSSQKAAQGGAPGQPVPAAQKQAGPAAQPTTQFTPPGKSVAQGGPATTSSSSAPTIQFTPPSSAALGLEGITGAAPGPAASAGVGQPGLANTAPTAQFNIPVTPQAPLQGIPVSPQTAQFGIPVNAQGVPVSPHTAQFIIPVTQATLQGIPIASQTGPFVIPVTQAIPQGFPATAQTAQFGMPMAQGMMQTGAVLPGQAPLPSSAVPPRSQAIPNDEPDTKGKADTDEDDEPAASSKKSKAEAGKAQDDLKRTPPPPRKKKKKKQLLVVMCVAMALLIGLGTLAFVLLGGKDRGATQQEYQALLSQICSSSTPREVTRHAEQLSVFNEANPGTVDVDLLTLMKACQDYVAADEDSEATYTDMLDALEALRRSPIEDIAACAVKLMVLVNSAYDDYTAFISDSSTTPPSLPSIVPTPGSSSGDSSTEGEGDAAVPYELGDEWAAIHPNPYGQGPGISFTFTNTSDKIITYFECIFFCYDAEGNPLIGKIDGYSFEQCSDEPNLRPGRIHTPENNGYWHFKNVQNAKHAIPVITFIRFDDGTTWGFTDSSFASYPLSDDLANYYFALQAECDNFAKKEIESQS